MKKRLTTAIDALPLRQKLTAIIFLASFSVSFIGLAAFVANNIFQLRDRIQQEAQTIARTVAGYGAADLAFRDQVAARTTLQGLDKTPQIANAFLYDDTGRLFVQQKLSPTAPPAPPMGTSLSEIRDDYLHVIEPVRYKDKTYGALYIFYSLQVVEQQVQSALVSFISIMLAALVLSLLLAIWLQRIISRPILNLAAVANIVSKEGNYTRRAPSESNDEIGHLGTAFNAMLDQIQLREQARSVAAQELTLAKLELEQRVRDRTAELETANKELEAFSYSVSHDLRAPLRSINGFAHALAEDYGSQLDVNARDYLNRVQKASERMGLLIDDLLNLSRLSRAPLHRDGINLSAIASEVIDDLRKTEPGRSVDVVITPDMTCNGDPNLLRVALQNLIGNAWKYTRRTAQAHIKFTVTKENDRHVYCVRDNGAGFNMQYADKLFSPFQRLHSAQEFEGTGVGLATVSRVIKRHGGNIWAESVVGQGATFCFTLGEAQGGV